MLDQPCISNVKFLLVTLYDSFFFPGIFYIFKVFRNILIRKIKAMGFLSGSKSTHELNHSYPPLKKQNKTNKTLNHIAIKLSYSKE